MRCLCGSINARERPWASKRQPIDYKRCCTDRLNAHRELGHSHQIITSEHGGTETAEKTTVEAARAVHWGAVVSARSGETEDVTIVHLAVGWGVLQLKVGSFSRSERVPK